MNAAATNQQIRQALTERPAAVADGEPDWPVYRADRKSGEWAECPQCQARFGGMTICPFCDGQVRLLRLLIT